MDNFSPIESIDPSKTALIVVDMQRYFVSRDSAYGRVITQLNEPGATAYFERVDSTVIPNIQRLQASCRGAAAQLAYTEFGSVAEDGRDMPGWARRHNDFAREAVGNPTYPPFADASCRVDDTLEPEDGEIIVQKTTSGPVNSTKLDHALRQLGVDTVIVTGVVTDVCVAQTAREFGDRDFTSIVVEDACASMDADRHQRALETIALTFGRVLSTDEVVGLIESGAA